MSGDSLHPTMAQARDLARWSICGSSSIYDPRDAVRAVFSVEEEDGDDVRGAQFMYLFRRFGYPIYGWDDHKDIVSYYLTTPDPDVILWCKPYCTPDLSFGYGVSPALDKEAMQAVSANWRTFDKHPIHQRIDRAIRAALTELWRPVYVRDVPYNIIGRVYDDLPHGDLDAAEPSPQAGYGLGNYDPVTEA